MTQAQIIEGTTEEVTRQIQKSYAGQKVRVFIEPEESENLANENLASALPAPPFTVRDQAHLEELLLEGLNGPFQKFTDSSMEEIRQEVHRRHAARQQP